MDFDKLLNILNEINNKGHLLTVRSANLLNKSLETLEIIKNCTRCKDNTGEVHLNKLNKQINDIEDLSVELEKEQYKKFAIYYLSDELFNIDTELNREMCEDCKRKKIKKLTDECRNEEIAEFLY